MGNCLRCRNSDTQSEDEQREENRRTDQQSRRVGYPGYLENDPILHPAPGISRPMSQLTEEEQVKIATRMGLISTLPLFTFTEDKREKLTECIICMCEYEEGDELRYLPCLHTYHRNCIDDWLMRSLTCPSCLEELRPCSPNVSRSSDPNRHPPPLSSREAHSSEPPLYSAATTAPLTAGDSSTDSQKRGDEANSRPRNQSTLTATESQLDSSTCQSPTKSPPDTTNSKNNSSGGDCSSVVLQQSRYHRRTRSNGTLVSLTDSTIRSPPPAVRPGNIRRGNSVTDLDGLPFTATSMPSRQRFRPNHPQGANGRNSQVGPRPPQHLPRQLGGDSHEVQPR